MNKWLFLSCRQITTDERCLVLVDSGKKTEEFIDTYCSIIYDQYKDKKQKSCHESWEDSWETHGSVTWECDSWQNGIHKTQLGSNSGKIVWWWSFVGSFTTIHDIPDDKKIVRHKCHHHRVHDINPPETLVPVTLKTLMLLTIWQFTTYWEIRFCLFPVYSFLLVEHYIFEEFVI